MRRLIPTAVRNRRSGATTVEMAVVLPVFFTFMFGLIEISHAFFIVNTLNAATKKAARYGVSDGVSTAQVTQKVQDVLKKAMKTTNVTVMIKNAGTFDTAGMNASTINYNSLPAIELSGAQPRQLFIVRASVPYDKVSLMPPWFVKGVTLSGQSVMRHE